MNRNEKFMGFVPVVGTALGILGYHHDDLGLAPEMVGDLLEKSRANATYIPHIEWRFLKPEKDDEIRWELIEKMFLPMHRIGIEPFVYLAYDFTEWITSSADPWKEAESLMGELVSWYLDKGVKYFIFENEPNMYGRADWAEFYMSHLISFHKVVRSLSDEARIIAGNLSENAYKPGGAWEELYRLGFKDYSDILGYHPYSDEPSTGIDIIDAGLTHKIMEKYDDGDKPMFFGEGWGPKRLLKQHPRIEDESIDGEEVEFMRLFLINGYNCLMTKTDSWNPDWFMGALFFTLNDNYGKMRWKERVRHVDNDGDGIPDTWYIDNVWLGQDEPDVDPEFYNGALVDLDGLSKSGLLEMFPRGLVPEKKI